MYVGFSKHIGTILNCWAREGQHQSDVDLNLFKGNVGETSERRGGAHKLWAFPERIDTLLNRTELCWAGEGQQHHTASHSILHNRGAEGRDPNHTAWELPIRGNHSGCPETCCRQTGTVGTHVAATKCLPSTPGVCRQCVCLCTVCVCVAVRVCVDACVCAYWCPL